MVQSARARLPDAYQYGLARVPRCVDGGSLNLLFVCTENRLRSATAEEVFSAYESISAIGAGTNSDAETTVSGDLIEWADVVFVMEQIHRSKVSKKFGDLLRGKRLICLSIPDKYERMQPELVRLLERKVSQHVQLHIDE